MDYDEVLALRSFTFYCRECRQTVEVVKDGPAVSCECEKITAALDQNGAHVYQQAVGTLNVADTFTRSSSVSSD